MILGLACYFVRSLTAPPPAGTLGEAIAAYQRRDYEATLRLLKHAADTDVLETQLSLGAATSVFVNADAAAFFAAAPTGWTNSQKSDYNDADGRGYGDMRRQACWPGCFR